MPMIKIVCPKCQAEAKLSLVDANFSGPRRCWKCHEAFKLTIRSSQVTACEPMSTEEFDKWMAERKAEEKAGGGGMTFSKKEEAPARQDSQPSQPPQEFFRPKMDAPSKPAAPKQGAIPPGDTFPPMKVSTFIPIEEIKDPPKKPQKPKGPPPERFNSFIPPQK
jgi:hypothetical protein